MVQVLVETEINAVVICEAELHQLERGSMITPLANMDSNANLLTFEEVYVENCEKPQIEPTHLEKTLVGNSETEAVKETLMPLINAFCDCFVIKMNEISCTTTRKLDSIEVKESKPVQSKPSRTSAQDRNIVSKWKKPELPAGDTDAGKSIAQYVEAQDSTTISATVYGPLFLSTVTNDNRWHSPVLKFSEEPHEDDEEEDDDDHAIVTNHAANVPEDSDETSDEKHETAEPRPQRSRRLPTRTTDYQLSNV